MYYQNEVRDFGQIPKGDSQRITQEQLELGEGLIERMSSDKFEPEKYRGEYRLRVLALVDAKIKGRQIVATLITYSRGALLGLGVVLPLMFLKSRAKFVALPLVLVLGFFGRPLVESVMPQQWLGPPITR